jgi:hypothetical protein
MIRGAARERGAREASSRAARFIGNGAARNLLTKTLDSGDSGPIIRECFFHIVCGCARELVEEVIMTGKRNYFPSVDLKNLHIPIT